MTAPGHVSTNPGEPNVTLPVWNRYGTLAGIAFGVLFIVGQFALFQPESSQPQAINEFYADSGNRTIVIVAAYLVALAGVFFLWFLAHLRRFARSLGGDTSVTPDIVLAGGIIFLALIYTGVATIGTGAAAMVFGGEEQFSAETLTMLPQLGYGMMLAFAPFGAIAVVVAMSLTMKQSAAMPSWLVWMGITVAVLLLASITYLPLMLFPIWAITTSITLHRRLLRAEGTTAQPQRAMAAGD